MYSKICKPMLFVFLLSIISSCGGGETGKAADGKANKISASQIVFQGNKGVQLASLSLSGGVIDPNIKVLAENVTIDTASNALKSDNLQDALDKEIAVSLSKVLTGNTWQITNKTSDTTYTGTTGIVKFNADGTMTLVSGYFAAIGKVNGNENPANGIPCSIPQTINYELISDGVMYVTALVKFRNGSTTTTEDSVLKIVSKSSDKIVVTGAGGCGVVGSERISILTPQNVVTTTNKTTPKALSHI